MTSEATAAAALVEKDQSNTTNINNNNNNNILKAKDIVNGTIHLTDLTEPYLFIYDDDHGVFLNNAEEEQDHHHLAKAVNIILAKKMGYKVVTPCYVRIISERVVCMVK